MSEPIDPATMEAGKRLTLTLLAMRGGRATDAELSEDWDAWQREHGAPTLANVQAWARAHDFEIEFGLAVSDLRLRSAADGNSRSAE